MVLSISASSGGPAGLRLFLSERDSDVAIRVEWEGRGHRFPAHRLILAATSDVFRTMLDADMIEKSTRTVTIRDSSPHHVKSFLRYLYTGILDFQTWSDAAGLLKLAHKYGVHALLALAEAYLATQLSFGNACALYELSRTYSLKLLRRQAATLVLDGAFVVSSTEGFSALKARSLETFLADPAFNAEGEPQVLNCLKDWATAECIRKCIPLSSHNVLSLMEPFLQHVRWPRMPENSRSFVPAALVPEGEGDHPQRHPFHVPASLQPMLCHVKLVVELGSFHEGRAAPLCCLRFSIDSHLFLCGFRMVGLFGKAYGRFLDDPSQLSLVKDGTATVVQFNLNSLPWSRGTASGGGKGGSWREMIAYLPYPVRLDPFSSYTFDLNTRSSAKWPRTRLDTEVLDTRLGTVAFKAFAHCYALTQLFVLPAPPYKPFCLSE